MTVHVPHLPGSLDPLIAEAKRRARQRRGLLAALAVLVVAAAVGGSFALRSSAAVTALCASAPPGLKEHYIPKSGLQEATVVLTNFRFGAMNNLYGLAVGSGTRWPPDGITLAVSNEGPDATPPFRPALRVTGADFQGFEGNRWPTAHLGIHSQGRVLEAFIEARTVTPATIATANRALASVRACSG